MKRIIFVFFVIWFYKLFYNIYLLLRANALYSKYKNYVQEANPNNCDIAFELAEIKEIFNKANIKEDLQVPFDNLQASGKIKPLLNITNIMPEITNFYNLHFCQSIGYFKKNIRDTFNPFYWIEFCIYFPQKLLNYINVVNQIVIHIFNILYWIVSILFIWSNHFIK